jgi:hypothetical protein
MEPVKYIVHEGTDGALFLEVPYEVAVSRHPNEVQGILTSWRRSRRKKKNDPPEAFAWVYCTQEVADAESLFGEGENLTLVAQLWALEKTPKGPGTGYSDYVNLDPLPPEVLAAWGRTEAVRKDPNPFRLPEGMTVEEHLRDLGFHELKP